MKWIIPEEPFLQNAAQSWTDAIDALHATGHSPLVEKEMEKRGFRPLFPVRHRSLPSIPVPSPREIRWTPY